MSSQAESPPAPEISVVVPTYQRREMVLALLRSLAEQDVAGDFEVVVVVDGSTDGTAEALRVASVPFTLRVLEHPNRGLAATRNRGARNSRGRILLFLDDDMEPDSRLLSEHLRMHRAGADVVIGFMPLHPDSPDTLLARGVGRWAQSLRDRLASPDEHVRWDDVFGGQLSVARDVFTTVGGFDEQFARSGGYGNEDNEFGYRLLAAGYRLDFNPRAISYQRYEVSAAENITQMREVGRADVTLAREHPAIAPEVFDRHLGTDWPVRVLGRVVLAAPRLATTLVTPARHLVARRLDRGCRDEPSRRLFRLVRAIEYWRGVWEAGGIPRVRAASVLCYHSLSDLSGDPVLAQYGMPIREFEGQLRQLRRSGYHFITPDEFLRSLVDGGSLPRRPLLLTFDDAYCDLAEALPILANEGITCVVFAVSEEVGGSNRWDQEIGARPLPLMDVEGLKQLVSEGHEIGAHGRAHRMLTRLSPSEVVDEVEGCLEDLRRMGFERPRFFSYPHGEHNEQVREAARSAGVQAALTVDRGRACPGADPWAVPRIEIFRRDTGWPLRFKLATARRRSPNREPAKSARGSG